jgi:anaerobic ribonucleoside-triphosphate reductase activating protein
MYISGYYKESINEGDGLRSVIFISGCKHACKGCFNQEAWNFKYGELFTVKKQLEIIEDVLNNPLIKGITICGGDPFFSSSDVLEFVLLCKKYIKDINIWIYSGFTYEEIVSNKEMFKLLVHCDVLIDGKFIESERDVTLKFRGSRNQNIIDIKKSIEENCKIMYEISS